MIPTFAQAASSPAPELRALLLVHGMEELADALGSGADALLIAHGAGRWPDLLGAALAAYAGPLPVPDIYAAVNLDGLDAIVQSGSVLALLRGVILESAQMARIEQLSAQLAVAEAQGGLADGVLRILAVVADTRSALAMAGTPPPDREPRLAGLIFDEDELARRLGVQTDAEPVRTARGLSILAADARAIAAIAGPDYSTGAETVRRTARQAKANGFVTQIAVSLPQLQIISDVFGHSERLSR